MKRDRPTRSGSRVRLGRLGRERRPVVPRRPGRPGRPPGRQGELSRAWFGVLLASGLVLVFVAFFAARALTHPAPTPTPARTVAPTATVVVPAASATPAITREAPQVAPTTTLPAVFAPDIPALQQLMLALINLDRQANGLESVAWDGVAATAGLAHAEEMVQFGYLSHWNLEGQGPDYRYSLVGGLNHVRENVYLYQHSPGGGPVSREAWEALIRQAQQSLLESPLHRDNILSPEHTYVGIGIAYNAATGYLGIAQEFVDHYVTLQPLPSRASLGEAIVIRGRLEAGTVNPLINLAYEPFPATLTVTELKATSTYDSPAEIYEVVPLSADAGGRFSQSVILDNQAQAGLYHVRVWVETKFGQVLAADIIVGVR